MEIHAIIVQKLKGRRQQSTTDMTNKADMLLNVCELRDHLKKRLYQLP